MTKEGANKSMIELHQTEMEAFPNMKVGNSTGKRVGNVVQPGVCIISTIIAA